MCEWIERPLTHLLIYLPLIFFLEELDELELLDRFVVELLLDFFFLSSSSSSSFLVSTFLDGALLFDSLFVGALFIVRDSFFSVG